MNKRIISLITACIAVAIIATYSLSEFKSTAFSIQKSKAYEIARPHYGPLVELQEVELTYIANIANAFLPLNIAEKISTYQKVVLYDKENTALPLGGEVLKITEVEGKAKVVILLPRGTKTEYLSNKANIIIRDNIGVGRLPLSALQHEDGQHFIWRTLGKNLKNTEETKITTSFEKVMIAPPLKNNAYFVEQENKINPADFIVLTPDKDITENKDYDVTIVDFKAPLHNPIKQAWIDLEIQKLKDQRAEMKEAIANCQAGTVDNPQGGETSNAGGGGKPVSSCGSSFDTTDPFVIFQNLINQVP